jgi:hypothetical protein
MHYPANTALPPSALRSYTNDNFVLPTSKGSLTGLASDGSPSMTTIGLVAAAAAAVWYFWLRKK